MTRELTHHGLTQVLSPDASSALSRNADLVLVKSAPAQAAVQAVVAEPGGPLAIKRP